MLNLTIAMRRLFLALTALFALLMIAPAAAQQNQPEASFSAPTGGQALQGIVSLNIEINVEDLRSMELAFRYAGIAPENWFVIFESSQVAQTSLSVPWDTTTISDGTYDLRLSVGLPDGGLFETITEGVRVRNYSTIETNTPAPTPSPMSSALPSDTPVPTIIPTLTPPAATPLPPNPAAITNTRLLQTVLQGGLVTVLAFGLLSLYAYLSRRRYEG